VTCFSQSATTIFRSRCCLSKDIQCYPKLRPLSVNILQISTYIRNPVSESVVSYQLLLPCARDFPYVTRIVSRRCNCHYSCPLNRNERATLLRAQKTVSGDFRVCDTKICLRSRAVHVMDRQQRAPDAVVAEQTGTVLTVELVVHVRIGDREYTQCSRA